MKSDPDHVLDAIDGVVDDWEATSADSMRWAPPEEHKGEDLLRELGEIIAPLANALTQVLRPVGDAVERTLDFLSGEDDQR